MRSRIKHLTPDDAGTEGRTLNQLKRDETEQRVRKLKIENDSREGSLVDVAEMKIAFGRKIHAMCDILDSIPTRVKMESPDVSQGILEVVQRCVTEVRNEAAAHRLDGDLDELFQAHWIIVTYCEGSAMEAGEMEST